MLSQAVLEVVWSQDKNLGETFQVTADSEEVHSLPPDVLDFVTEPGSRERGVISLSARLEGVFSGFLRYFLEGEFKVIPG